MKKLGLIIFFFLIVYQAQAATLTVGNIPKVNTGGTTPKLADSIISEDGSNVGIGTTAPAYLLDVNGTARVVGAWTAITAGITGVLTLDADDIAIYDAGPTFASDNQIVTKKYVDDNEVGATYLTGLSDVDTATATAGDLLIAGGDGNFDSIALSGDVTVTADGVATIAYPGAYVIDGIAYAQTSTGINAAITALGTDDGIIYMPCGAYALTSTVTVAPAAGQEFMLVGDGSCTVLTRGASMDADAINITGANAKKWVLADFALVGNKGNNASGDGIEINTDIASDANALIRDVRVDSFDGDGVVLTAGNDLREVLLVSVISASNDGDGIEVNGSDHRLENCLAYWNLQHGINVTAGSTQIIGGKAFGNGTASSSPTFYYGLDLNYSQNVIVSGFYSQDNSTHGIVTDGPNTIIIGSTSQNNAYDAAIPGAWAGLKMEDGADDSIISGNEFYDDDSGNQDYGIMVDDGVYRSKITANILRGNGTAGIYNDGYDNWTNNDWVMNELVSGETNKSITRSDFEVRDTGIVASTISWPLIANSGAGIEAPASGGVGLKLQLGQEMAGNDANKYAGIAAWATGSWGTDSTLAFYTADNGAPTAKMVIDPTGNVGIGTSAPSVELEVNGDFTNYGNIVTSTGTTVAPWQGCVQVQDSDNSGWTYITTLNGVLHSTIGTCP